ncbi:hypothetical protein Tco_1334883 [Tanacetum coccineum]
MRISSSSFRLLLFLLKLHRMYSVFSLLTHKPLSSRAFLHCSNIPFSPCGISETSTISSANIKHQGSGYQQKDRKPSQNDKTEHGMEKTVQNQRQIQNGQVRAKTEESEIQTEPELKNTIECNLKPIYGPGSPNSIIMKYLYTKWALNQIFQQPICVQLTKTVKTLKAQS